MQSDIAHYAESGLLATGRFPLILEQAEPQHNSLDTLLSFLRSHRQWLYHKLLENGAILFRGFSVRDQNDFATVARQFTGGKALDYVGGATLRTKLSDEVYTSTEVSPRFKIRLHNEMSYWSHPPEHILFFCDVEPAQGGETPICDARTIYRELDPQIREEFVRRGLKSINTFWHRGRISSWPIFKLRKTWQSAFETEDRQVADQKCRKMYASYRWLRTRHVRVDNEFPAVRIHPVTGEKVWFNSAHVVSPTPKQNGWLNYLKIKLTFDFIGRHIQFTDGRIPLRYIDQINSLLEEKAVIFKWQKSDLLLLDNYLTSHGRMPFRGERRILVSMFNFRPEGADPGLTDR